MIGLALVGLHGVTADAQRCREPHYRWTQKIDTALADLAPRPASVAAMLATWTPPDLGPRERCALRSERERDVYGISAWVRRVDKHKDDGDWHIELTERADSPSDSCVVIEIPAPQYSPRYAGARAALDSLIGDVKVRKRGVLARPLRARISGAAFFDGQHRRGERRSDKIDGAHGRCNSSVRALWEIHPVYRVTAP